MATRNQPQQPPATPDASNGTDRFTVSTSPAEGKAPKNTQVALDWAGVTVADLMDRARRSIVIDLQREWRKHGIPADFTAKVSEILAGSGRRARTITPDRVLATTENDPAAAERLAALLMEQAKKSREAAVPKK